MRHAVAAIAFLLAGSTAACGTAPSRPPASSPPPSPTYLGRAHAHNDYARGRPLLEALERGFGSVEVDVVLLDGEVYVAHERDEIRPSDTLVRLYLEPLRDLVRGNGGSVYAVSDASLQLLIDVKSPADETYHALDRQLGAYDEIFTRWTKDGVRTAPVTAVLSGNRALSSAVADTVRYLALDGRIDDERSDFSVEAMPLVSIDWQTLESLPSNARLTAARAWIDLVHRENRRIRFWGTPEQDRIWASLMALGADHIGADDVVGLERTLRVR